MVAYDENVAKGIYEQKCWGNSLRICCKILKVEAVLVLIGIICPAFVFFFAPFFIFGMMFITKGGTINISPEDVLTVIGFLAVILPIVFCLVTYAIKYYFCNINCGLVKDKENFCVISYFRGKKIERIIRISDIKGIEWQWLWQWREPIPAKDYLTYEDKNYVNVTICVNENEKIRNIPVEYKSEMFNYLDEFRKALYIWDKGKKLSV